MFQKCFVLPIHAVHLINAKQDANIILGLIKSVVAPKVMKRVRYCRVSSHFENRVHKNLKNKQTKVSGLYFAYFNIVLKNRKTKRNVNRKS